MSNIIGLKGPLLQVIENVECPGTIDSLGFPRLVINYYKFLSGKKNNKSPFINAGDLRDQLEPSRNFLWKIIDDELKKRKDLVSIPEYIIPIENRDLWDILGGKLGQSFIRYDWLVSGIDLELDDSTHIKFMDHIRDAYSGSLGISVKRINTFQEIGPTINSLKPNPKASLVFKKNNAAIWWFKYQEELLFLESYFNTYKFPSGPYKDGSRRITYDQIFSLKSINHRSGYFCKPGPWENEKSDEYKFLERLKFVFEILFNSKLLIKENLLDI